MRVFKGLIALLAYLSAPALAFSSQPEYIAPAALFEAQEERTDLRYEIRFYFELTEAVCPSNPTESFQAAFLERDRNFENFVSSMQDTPLLLDVNIAVQDGQKNAYERQSVVDCEFIERPAEVQEASFEIELKLAHDQLAKVKTASQIALQRLGTEEEE